ncbi:tyrosine-type recombinase/integrase [Ralstonia pseudosolanacearum]|uniref:tyrosine-type recombinase/integrase n=1 Tax=Ralstonia pseudosolanacearum TaxID=1310165 RepID=UPI00201D7612|nr:tyrosine-type recombinase/integrase [Ralstonia pseudosolanacearum]UQY83665.1 site-specific integrase [Ralstonia pseudosolanacearum]
MKKRSNGGSLTERKLKDGSSSWMLKYEMGRDGAGKRQIGYATVRGTKSEAQKELRRLMVEVDTGTHVEPSKMTFAQWIEQWLSEVEKIGGVSTRTKEGYASWMRVHVIPSLGGTLLQKLKRSQLNAMFVQLRESGHKGSRAKGDKTPAVKGLSAQSVVHIRRTVHTCLQAAVDAELIQVNPATRAKVKGASSRASTEDASTTKIKALEADQLPALFAAFRGHALYPLVALAVGTGLRRGEILGLRWKSIDFDKMTLRVEQTVEQTREHGVRVKPDAKNKSSLRTIGISAELRDLLRAHLAEQKSLALKLGTSYPAKGEALVFPCVIQRPKGRQPAEGLKVRDVDFSRPWHPEAVTKEFTRIAAAADFAGFRLHDCRHTFATLLLTSGVELHTVARLLGHSTPAITLSTYSHVLPRAADRAVQVSGDLLRAALQG